MASPLPKILRLPDELLAQILGLVVVYPTRSWWAPDFDKFFKNAVSTLLVCRRFYGLATPYLYRQIEVAAGQLGLNPAASSKATEHLYRTLSQDSSLRQHCRILHVHIGGKSDDLAPGAHLNIGDFAKWLVGTRRLLVDGGFNLRAWDRDNLSRPAVYDVEGTWNLIRVAVRSMVALSELSLIAAGYGLLSLETIVETLRDATHLRVLSLTGVSLTGIFRACTAFEPRSSPITTLNLSDFQDTPENLKRLLLLPANLENFSFSFLYSNMTGPWNLSVLGSAISPHKSTLRTLLIGSLRARSLENFDLAGFTALEELSISYWATGCEAGHEAKLLAPRLRELTWSFHVEDQQSESYYDFQEPQESWLRRLAAAAIEQKVPLRKIHINFKPSDDRVRGEVRPKEWPWDCMDRVASEVRDLGIFLSYEEPCIQKGLL
ncbi:hypothetical protein B0T25DRAFT_298401 [Lasiosphaeria hispida]|uniref:F-box domain-containing protein n=1 Tax=Lasiosphaeria hispida TaxID=260671 RepID=A0AAJ0HDF1_9PEZI|nr:hypothetical protein B0T25DRAFT_298401 [Lasiosphaeria hispida]